MPSHRFVCILSVACSFFGPYNQTADLSVLLQRSQLQVVLGGDVLGIRFLVSAAKALTDGTVAHQLREPPNVGLRTFSNHLPIGADLYLSIFFSMESRRADPRKEMCCSEVGGSCRSLRPTAVPQDGQRTAEPLSPWLRSNTVSLIYPTNIQ